jgi:tripartite-type tricarboxylate transporter receptor subunit TctC
VPTLDEVGLKGYDVTAWFGVAAPAGTPREVVMRLNEALNRSTSDAQVREALESRGATVIQGTPEDCLAFVKNELEKWGPVVKRANVVPD